MGHIPAHSVQQLEWLLSPGGLAHQLSAHTHKGVRRDIRMGSFLSKPGYVGPGLLPSVPSSGGQQATAKVQGSLGVTASLLNPPVPLSLLLPLYHISPFCFPKPLPLIRQNYTLHSMSLLPQTLLAPKSTEASSITTCFLECVCFQITCTTAMQTGRALPCGLMTCMRCCSKQPSDPHSSGLHGNCRRNCRQHILPVGYRLQA